MKITAVIVAAGRGSRMGAEINKVFLKIKDKTILEYTLDVLEQNNKIDNIVIVTRECDIEKCNQILLNYDKISHIVCGGNTRQKSVFNGLMNSECDYVLIHDGARALIGNDEINNVIDDCIRYECAALGVKCKDTLKMTTNDGFIEKTIDREFVYSIQTPQAFKYSIIKKAHERAIEDGFETTDDCALIEKYDSKIKITEGSYENIKLTTPEDMIIAKMILKKRGVI